MSPMAALWRWPVRTLAAHVLLFVVLLVPSAVLGNDGGAAALFGVDRYLGGSVLYLVLLLPLVLVLGLALGVVAGGALQLWGARPLLAAAVVGLAAAALALTALSWFDGWDRIPPLTALAHGMPIAVLAGLLTVRDARRLGGGRVAARTRRGVDLPRERTPAAG
jgi:hypothetical protein